MLIATRGFTFFILLILSNLVFAQSSLTAHAISVSQSMSAFYMYSLSDGDGRYKTDYEKYLQEAGQHLLKFEKQDSLSATELKNQWDKFLPYLEFEYIDGAGYIVPTAVRLQYRNYLSAVYKKITEVVNSETNLSEQMQLMSLSVEVMSARFYDVSDAMYGAMSISSNDLTIDPPKMANALKLRLAKIQQMNLSPELKKAFSSVKRKWEFIEKSVLDYKGDAAYLLVYYSKRQISKLLKKSRVALAGV